MNFIIKQRIEQIQRGELPEGYKETKVGIIPSAWSIEPLGKYIKVGQGFTFKECYQGVQGEEWNYFKVVDIGTNSDEKYLSSAINTISDDIKEEIGCSTFPPKSIVFPRVGEALMNNNKKLLAQESIVDDNVLVVTVIDSTQCDPEYLFYWFQSIQLSEFCNSGLVPVISASNVKKHKFPNIPLREQKQIANILSNFDRILTLKKSLLSEKQKQRTWIMQNLLTGRKRLSGFSDEWKQDSLAHVSEHVNRKAENGEYEVLSISAGIGFVNQEEKFGKKIAGEQYKNYTIIEQGDFAYNKGNSRKYPQGCIYMLEDRDIAVVPNVFISFRLDKHFCYSPFYKFLFELGYLNNQLIKMINSGVRNNGLLNLYDDDFFECLVPVPTIKEQIIIAEIIQTITNEIDLIKGEISEQMKLKKALIRLLLTGIARTIDQ